MPAQTSEQAFEAFAAAGAMIEESNEPANEPVPFEEGGGDQEESPDDNDSDVDELKELRSRIEEKLAEKGRPNHKDTRPEEVRTDKPHQ